VILKYILSWWKKNFFSVNSDLIEINSVKLRYERVEYRLNKIKLQFVISYQYRKKWKWRKICAASLPFKTADAKLGCMTLGNDGVEWIGLTLPFDAFTWFNPDDDGGAEIGKTGADPELGDEFVVDAVEAENPILLIIVAADALPAPTTAAAADVSDGMEDWIATKTKHFIQISNVNTSSN